ncbi:formylglycine-generating enzyme family protein [Zunongwangia sp. F363]|uniref:Formylglycine-generating enzyme family protein n=1 Tax=Autumnicola tepida TaxID=3075595 RepID=A0ABU3CB27_9FLAO|nr:formylglycine-generating enzyme family protein [Zunongwangia sp. F363]MDT0643550.1 formylglycine-generating enzyme family protein [Zunongwangia sp. F363]
MKLKTYIIFITISAVFLSCQDSEKETHQDSIPQKETTSYKLLVKKPDSIAVPEGMKWVSGVKFTMGATEDDPYALPREKPAHPVAVDGFFMDVTEVTNAEFARFVEETGYVTVAERPIDWEEMKKQLPAGTPKPHDSILQPGSLVFRKSLEKVTNLNDYSQWWEWEIGADWRHPYGPGTNIEGKMNYPVVHVSYEDALAYCKWAGRSLPTEAEWEAAAKGQLNGGIYTWGDEEKELNENANTWQGSFPTENKPEDGFSYAAPVKSFPPNSIGLYDMAGNVWEITTDWFDVNYYKQALNEGELINPEGSQTSYNPDNPYEMQKVMKGGSFLCNKSYCASYRISARMGMSLDSGTDHVGFRTVLRPEKK